MLTPAGPSASPTPTAPPTGGTLRIGLAHRPGIASLTFGYPDPHRTLWFSEAFPLTRCCLYRTLMAYPGLELELGGASVQPDLASGPPSMSRDGLTWTFRLREGIRYGPPFDDREVVAQDVVRALERAGRLQHELRDPDDAYWASETADIYRVIEGFGDYVDRESPTISGIETPDRHTVVFRLTRPTGDFDRRMATPATTPLPEGAADGHVEDYAGYAPSTGPYRFEPSDKAAGPWWSGRQPGSMVLVRNPSWSRASDPVRGAWVDRIEIKFVANEDDGHRKVGRGEIDFLFDHFETPDEQAKIVALDGSRRRLPTAPINVATWLPMNLAMPPFDDVAVRRAVAHAVDRPALLEQTASQFGEVLLPARHALPDGATNGLLEAYDPYRVEDGANVAAAREHMAASRYDTNGDGRCDAPACRGVPTVVRADLGEGAVAGIVDDLAAIGIELDVERVPGSPRDFYQRLLPENRVAFVLFANYLAFDVDAGQYVESWDGRLAGDLSAIQTSLIGATPEQLAGWGYEVTHVPSVDSKIDECSSLIRLARSACWAEFDQLITEGIVPAVFVARGEGTFLIAERVVEFHIDQAAGQPALDQIAIAGG